MFDTVECPYCGFENDMSEGCVDLPRDNKFDHECGGCEKDFEVYVEFYPTYNSNEIVYKDCGICGINTRIFKEKGKVFPYPKKYTVKTVCEKCYYKGIQEEFYREREDKKNEPRNN